VSGTVLSFEFGLLWPNFMGKYGAPRPISEPTATATPAGAQAMTTVLGALMIVTLAAVGRRRRTRSATR